MIAPVNPDCRDDKHRACGGDAWDFDTDQPADCSCPCHNRPPHRGGNLVTALIDLPLTPMPTLGRMAQALMDLAADTWVDGVSPVGTNGVRFIADLFNPPATPTARLERTATRALEDGLRGARRDTVHVLRDVRDVASLVERETRLYLYARLDPGVTEADVLAVGQHAFELAEHGRLTRDDAVALAIAALRGWNERQALAAGGAR